MSFNTPDYQAIRDAILRDIANQEPAANVASDGDFAIRANATGAAIEGLYQHQQWCARQIFPDTADTEALERRASEYGLARKGAAAATGSIDFTGVPGSAVAIGTEAKTLGGVSYLTTAAGVIGGASTLSLAAQAVSAGSAGNLAAGAALTLVAAPAGVQSAAVAGAMTGGSDIETDAGLLDRLLARIRQPPQGGAEHDYKSWAKDVAGVAEAYVYALRRGANTVDIVIFGEGGLPSAQLLSDTQDHIDYLRPVTADCLVFGPTPVPVAISASSLLVVGDFAAAAASITASLNAYFGSLKPGDTVYRNHISALISNTAGVVDFELDLPAANVVTLVDAMHVQLATLGVVTLT